MIKIITEEQDSFFNLFETEPKYKDLLITINKNDNLRNIFFYLLCQDETTINYLKQITEDSSLKNQLGILTTYNFLEYINNNGLDNLLYLIEEFSKRITINNVNRVEKVRKIFDYIDYLTYRDEISELVSGTTMKEDVLETLRNLRLEIENEQLKELTKRNNQLSSQNDSLIKDNDFLTKQNTELGSSVSNLSSERDSLRNEIDSLNRQIDNKRTLMNSLLDEEMKALRTKRLSSLDEQLEKDKKEKYNELNVLQDTKNELLMQIQGLEKKLESYKSIMGNQEFSFIGSKETEVEWVNIDENHEIWSMNKYTIDAYIEKLKLEYQKRTGKTKEECEIDFGSKCPELHKITLMLTKGPLRFYDISIKEIVKDKPYGYYEILDVLKKITLPKYKEKENTSSSTNINLQNYLIMLELKGQVAEATMKQKIAEAKLLTLINTVKEYVPIDFDFNISGDIIDNTIEEQPTHKYIKK